MLGRKVTVGGGRIADGRMCECARAVFNSEGLILYLVSRGHRKRG